MKWNTTRLMAAGSLGALLLVLTLSGSVLNVVTPFPSLGGIINGFFLSAIPVLGCLVLDQFGVATILLTVYGILAIPLPLWGIPGFALKPPMGFLMGLAVDVAWVVFRRTRRQRVSSVLVGGIALLANLIAVAAVQVLFRMPGVEQILRLNLSAAAIIGAFLMGCVGGILGWLVFSRIKDSPVVLRIRAQ